MRMYRIPSNSASSACSQSSHSWPLLSFSSGAVKISDSRWSLAVRPLWPDPVRFRGSPELSRRAVEVKHALWPDVWNPQPRQQNNRRVEIELSKHPLGAAHCVFEKVGWSCRTQRCSRKRPPLVALFAFTIIVRPSPRRFLWPLDRSFLVSVFTAAVQCSGDSSIIECSPESLGH